MAANFWTSSHFQKWILSNERLDKAKEKSRSDWLLIYEAMGKHSKYADERERLCAQIDPRDARDWDRTYSTLFIVLSDFVAKIGAKLCLRQRVIATASVYLHRFYAAESLAGHDPAAVCGSCIFLASKVEECIQTAHMIASAVRRLLRVNESVFTSHHVIRCEHKLITALRTSLIVFHPYRALPRYVAECSSPHLLDEIWHVVNDAYRTNLCLRYAPYKIGISAIFMISVLQRESTSEVQSFFVDHFRRELRKPYISDICDALLDMYEKWATIDDDQARRTIAALQDIYKYGCAFRPSRTT